MSETISEIFEKQKRLIGWYEKATAEIYRLERSLYLIKDGTTIDVSLIQHRFDMPGNVVFKSSFKIESYKFESKIRKEICDYIEAKIQEHKKHISEMEKEIMQVK